MSLQYLFPLSTWCSCTKPVSVVSCWRESFYKTAPFSSFKSLFQLFVKCFKDLGNRLGCLCSSYSLADGYSLIDSILFCSHITGCLFCILLCHLDWEAAGFPPLQKAFCNGMHSLGWQNNPQNKKIMVDLSCWDLICYIGELGWTAPLHREPRDPKGAVR